MASIVTHRGMYLILKGDVSLTTDTIKVMLLNSAFTPLATHNVISDISASELSVVGYTGGFAGSGRKTLASKTYTEDDAGGTATFDAADLTWTTISSAASVYAAIVKEVTADADSPVLAYIQFTAQVGGDLPIAWHANGIFRISAGDGTTAEVRNVTYTATGAEGTDFFVTIGGAALASDVYGVYPANKGAGSTGAVVPDMPDTIPSDRTTTTFRVLTADVLVAGAKLAFLIVE